jgi:uncharacterized protein (DUF1501 family)
MRPNMSVTDRRALLVGAGLGGLAALLPGHVWASPTGGVAGRKLILVILRGAMDGLAAVAPVGDPAYRQVRGQLALAPAGAAGGVLPLSDGFGLHPAFTGLHTAWNAGELSVLHAAATPYRDRSHFDGQDMLESGAGRVYGRQDGWLNRALALGPARNAVAVGPQVPLVLRGSAEASSWSPPRLETDVDDDTLTRLLALYEADPILRDALAMAQATRDMVGEVDSTEGRPRGLRRYEPLFEAAVRLASGPAGADCLVVSLDGWDTHAQQGAAEGQLAQRFASLDAGLGILKAGLAAAWSNTAVVVTTEFGRTVAVNGSGGTDHGTGGAAFLLGGAVRGGRMLGEWPGLSRLHEGRDLLPVNSLHSLFQGVLKEHWALSEADLRARVFTDTPLSPLAGVIA